MYENTSGAIEIEMKLPSAAEIAWLAGFSRAATVFVGFQKSSSFKILICRWVGASQFESIMAIVLGHFLCASFAAASHSNWTIVLDKPASHSTLRVEEEWLLELGDI